MKTITMILAALTLAIVGCANAQTQRQLDAANAKIVSLEKEHDLDAARLDEVRAEASKDNATCMEFIGAARKAETKIVEVATDAYNGAYPVVVAKLNQAWTEGVPAAEAYAHQAYDAARKEFKALAKEASK
jgi:hypothetical protein